MSKKKKLIFIATNALGIQSAEATHNVEMGIELNKKYDLTFIGGHYNDEKTPVGLDVIEKKHIIQCDRKLGKKAYFYYENKVKEVLKKTVGTKSGGIFVYIRYRLTGFFLFKYLIKNKIRYITEYNDKTVTQLKFYGERAKTWSGIGTFIRTNFITLKLIESYEAWVFNNSTIIRTVTPELNDYVRKIAKKAKNVKTIPNGTNTDKFYPLNKTVMKDKFGLPTDKLILLHVGSLTPWDGIEDILRGLPELENCLLVIVGRKNKYYEHLKEMVKNLKIESKVVFTGVQNQESVKNYIAAADLCLLLKSPMDYGLSPIKYYEYLACGRPVLTVDVPLINNVIKDKCGIALKIPLKTNLMIKKLKELSSEELEEMGENARAVAEKKYTWKQRAQELINAIENNKKNET